MLRTWVWIATVRARREKVNEAVELRMGKRLLHTRKTRERDKM